jgi:hypothetical protein
MADIEGEAKRVEDDGRGDSMNAINAKVGEGAGPEASPGVSGGGAMDAVTEAKSVIAFCVALFVPMYPSLGRVYTEEAQEVLAGVAVPLMQKYDLSLGGFFEKWGPEINFAIVAFPLGQATLAAVRADNAARAEAAKEAQAGGDGANQ